jgi:hypothetical protein
MLYPRNLLIYSLACYYGFFRFVLVLPYIEGGRLIVEAKKQRAYIYVYEHFHGQNRNGLACHWLVLIW